MIDLSKADERNAKLILRLRSDTGYSCEFTYRVSANQWGEIVKICERPVPNGETPNE